MTPVHSRLRSCLVLSAAAAALATLTASPASIDWDVTFTDVAVRAGLRETVVYGGLDRKRFILETNGSGVALIDYDNDG